jgi:hypothetical protein
MATEQEVRAAVEEFVRRESSPFEAERLFAAWVLHTQHQVNVLDALAQTGAAGGDDDAVEADIDDGYALFPGNAFRPPELLVLRAVFSNAESDVLAGLAALGRSLGLAGALAMEGEMPRTEAGPKLRRLKHVLDAMAPADRARLHLRGELAHLSGAEEAVWLQLPRVRKAINDFQVTLAHAKITPGFAFRPPREVRISIGPLMVKPAMGREVAFSGSRWGGAQESVLIGRGHLADLVGLYDHYREALFAKNVRTYLHNEAKKPRSAARHIREALEKICAGGPDLYFTMAHNGVTLTAPHVVEVSQERVRVEPLSLGLFVLNGCQTVYTAWKFFKDREAAEARDGKTQWRTAWANIWIPLRIVVTTDEERVREVTVAANRQTEMRPSAFWAHDAVQVSLDKRFGKRGIYYERQQDAWDNLVRTGSSRTAEYGNGVLNIEDLARVIAAVSHDVSIDHAKGPAGIFDSEVVYRKVFAPAKVRSTEILTALYNLQQATRLALRDLVESVGYLAGLPVMTFQYPVLRLLSAWLAENNPEWLLSHGERVYKGAALRDLREETAKLLGGSRSRIQITLRDGWKSGDGWVDAYNVKTLKQVARNLELTTSPFSLDVSAES